MPVSVKPVENRRLYQQVADQLRHVIASGGFTPGSRLPPERDLAQQLGVSRPSLREALIALELDGRVEVRMGSGVYVCTPPTPANRTTPALGESPTELMQARGLLESSVIMMAAARATSDQLARVSQCREAMRRDHVRGRPPLENDRRFHVSIAEISGNSVVVRLISSLFDERHSPISTHLSGRAENALSWTSALREHERIFAALEARDPHAAAAAMSNHLLASQERWIDENLSPPLPPEASGLTLTGGAMAGQSKKG